MSLLYSKEEIIWAKLSGYPWWPGVIKKIILKHKTLIENNKNFVIYEDTPYFLIQFYPDKSHRFVPFDKIEKFVSGFQEKSITKNRNLLKSIEMAKKEILNNNYKLKSELKPRVLFDILGKKRLRGFERDKQDKKEKKARQKKIERLISEVDDDNDDNESIEESNSSKSSKIKILINDLFKIKIESRGKEAHKQILLHIAKISSIFDSLKQIDFYSVNLYLYN